MVTKQVTSENRSCRIGYGVLLPPIKEQLAEQGMYIEDEAHLDRYEKQRYAIQVLDFAELLPQSQLDKALAKLHKRVTKDVKVVTAQKAHLTTKGGDHE